MPARSRPQVDWNTLDKLADINPGVALFLKSVAEDLLMTFILASTTRSPKIRFTMLLMSMSARKDRGCPTL